MILLWVHSLLLLLLFLFDIRLLPEEQEDVVVFATDAILLTASCSWFCTILLEFSSMFLCKISFSSSSNACLPFSVLKENRRSWKNQPMGDVLWKSYSFLPRLHVLDIGWPVLHKKVILTGDCFFSRIILPDIRTEGILSPRNSAVLVPFAG